MFKFNLKIQVLHRAYFALFVPIVGLTICPLSANAADAQKVTTIADFAVDIKINNEADVTKNVLQIKSLVNAKDANQNNILSLKRYSLTGTIAIKDATVAKPYAKDAPTVVLVNPTTTTTGQVKFFLPSEDLTDTNAKDSLTLTLPKNGTAVSFKISGERGSNAVGDVVINALQNAADGVNVGSSKLSVFWFSNPIMEVKKKFAYRRQNITLRQTDYPTLLRIIHVPLNPTPPPGDPLPAEAVEMEARVTFLPAGIDATAMQDQQFKLGFIQSVKPLAPTANGPQVNYSTTIGPPLNDVADTLSRYWFVVWKDDKTVVGQDYSIPKSMIARMLITPGLDGTADPFYEKGVAGDYPFSYQDVKIEGDSIAKTADGPNIDAGTPMYIQKELRNNVVVPIATLYYYSSDRTQINMEFDTWCAINNVSTNEVILVAQNEWEVHVDVTNDATIGNVWAVDHTSHTVTKTYPGLAAVKGQTEYEVGTLIPFKRLQTDPVE